MAHKHTTINIDELSFDGVSDFADFIGACPDQCLCEALDEIGEASSLSDLEEAFEVAQSDFEEMSMAERMPLMEAYLAWHSAQTDVAYATNAYRHCKDRMTRGIRGKSLEELEAQAERLERMLEEKRAQIEWAKELRNKKIALKRAIQAEDDAHHTLMSMRDAFGEVFED